MDLVKKSASSKYLLYAAGEILLVMIGILLALQVNNWNENRKERKIEKEYLIGLQEEFNTNRSELLDNMKVNEDVVGIAQQFFDLTGPAGTEVDDERLSEMFISLLRISVEYEPSPGVMEDLISAGNLNILSDPELRKNLSIWKLLLARAHRQEDTVLEYRSNIKDILIAHANLRRVLATVIDVSPGTFTNTNKDVLMDKSLENNLSFFIISSLSLGNEYYRRLLEVNEEIIQSIQQQI